MDLGNRFTKLLDDTATKADVKNLFDALISSLQTVRKQLEQQAGDNASTLTQKTTDAIGQLKDTEQRLTSLVQDTKATSASEIRTLTRLLGDEVRRVEALIPDVTDLGPIEQKIEDAIAALEAKIPSLPEEISATATRDKLESLTGDERLDASAIKGIPEFKEETKRVISGGLTRMKTDSLYTKYHGGASNITVSATEPTNPELHDLWIQI